MITHANARRQRVLRVHHVAERQISAELQLGADVPAVVAALCDFEAARCEVVVDVARSVVVRAAALDRSIKK